MSTTYKIDDKIICKQSADAPFGYVAKVIDVSTEDGSNTYTVHYNGWNSRYDEQLKEEELEARVVPWTDEAEKEHKKRMKEAKDKLGKKRKMGGDDDSKKGKRKAGDEGSSVTSSDTGATQLKKRPPVTVNIPDKLRAILLDDSDIINRQLKLAKLPARVTVDQIIFDYGKAVQGGQTGIASSANDELYVESDSNDKFVFNKHEMEESSLGVCDYFNATIGTQLLYKMEREQFNSFIRTPGENAPGKHVNEDDTPELENLKIVPSSIYGLAHLLRLFVRLGPLLAQTMWSDRSINLILKHVHDFLVWVSKNSGKYYNIEDDYEVADTTYVRSTYTS